MEQSSIPADAKGTLFVCCTSHMDWDWIGSFEDYYSWGAYSSDPGSCHNPVRYTLDQAFELCSSLPGFQFNLAEVAWLQRWLQDNPDKLGAMTGFGSKFIFLGGGITSPDNLVCHGEVFIRNYLVGRQYLKQIGLSASVSDVCWIPDDFGQDPELPATLNALGLKAAAFWRVPGFSPGPISPVDGSTSIYDQLLANGVCFAWKASDGSVSIGVLLADGYGVPFSISTTSPEDTAQQLDWFVTGYNKHNIYYPVQKWPTANQFVPAGADFSTPSADPTTNPATSNLLSGVSDYNNSSDYYGKTQLYAQLGTFDDYLSTLPSSSLNNPITLNPSNFWTGYFASRPQLKIDHYKATRYLLAAETALSMLQVFSVYSSGSLAGISRMIQAAWEALVPSSHHDFITGTAPDNTYWSEQLPMLESALDAAKNVLKICLDHMGKAIEAKADAGEVAVLVYNDLGFQRSVGTLVELSGAKAEFTSFNSVRIGRAHYPVQKNANGTLLFQCPALDSLSYQTVYLSVQEPDSQPDQNKITSSNGVVTMDNGRVSLNISETDNWAITSLMDNTVGENLVNGLANQILLYDDSGNLYQFGNELYPSGFQPESNPDLTATGGMILENGPLRWRFEGTLSSKSNNVSYKAEYTLVLNEPLVRMRLTGSAPAATTVVTCFSMVDQQGKSPLTSGGLSYGTANHWHVMDTVPYWTGPTFLPTHDFVLLNGQSGNIGGIYHRGIPAWTLDNGVLMGALLRNTDGNQRGAAGTDFAVHTQEYAFRLPGVGQPETCAPLQESYSVQEAPFARIIDANRPKNVVTLPVNNQLAALNETNALIRMVRTQAGSGSAATNSAPQANNTNSPLSLIFRLYQASNDTTQACTMNLLYNVQNQPVSAVECMTALEEESTQNGQAALSGSSVNIQNMPTLTTLRVQTVKPYLAPDDGR